MLVAGGGPAGLEAARVCAERGHEVRLCEASERLGGQVLLAAQASWRSQLMGIVEWRNRELERLGVDVRLNSPVEPESIDGSADVVIVATGGIPDLDWIDGAEHCTSVWDVLTGAVSAGEDSIVYDGTGRHAALTAAEAIGRAGGEVAFFGLDGHLAMEMSYAEQVVWRRRTYEIGIEPRLDRRLERVAREGNRLRVTFRNELTDEAEGARDRSHRGRARHTARRRPLSRPRGSVFEPRRRGSEGAARRRAAAGRRGRRLPAVPHRRRGLQPQHLRRGARRVPSLPDLVSVERRQVADPCSGDARAARRPRQSCERKTTPSNARPAG